LLTNIRENNFFSLHRPYVHISTICTTSQSYQYKIKGRKPSYSCLFLCVSNDPLKMGSSPTLALSLLIFFLCNLCAIQGSIFIQPVTTVVIFNQIEYGIPVTVHCKSKNDDLGVHVLPLGQGYSFKFRPNLVGTTLFFCSFTWTGQHQIYWFNVFDDKRDAGKCTTCRWIIHEYSMCLQDPKNPGKEICYNYGDKEPGIIM